MPVPIWAGKYIGLPFKDHGRDPDGLDCWGLVRLVHIQQFGIYLPSFEREYPSATAKEKISQLISREACSWLPISSGSEALGDVIVLNVRGAPMHVGMVLGDGQMLHIERGIDSVIEHYTTARAWHRIYGFFRHERI